MKCFETCRSVYSILSWFVKPEYKIFLTANNYKNEQYELIPKRCLKVVFASFQQFTECLQRGSPGDRGVNYISELASNKICQLHALQKCSLGKNSGKMHLMRWRNFIRKANCQERNIVASRFVS